MEGTLPGSTATSKVEASEMDRSLANSERVDSQRASAAPTLTPDDHEAQVEGKSADDTLDRSSLADEKAPEAVAAAPSPRDVHGIQWALVVIAILSSTFLFALDNTIVADVQPAIVMTFGEVNLLPWLSVAFVLAAASTNLVWGKIYGQFEAKKTYILSVILFETGSAICGGAPSMNALIVGRAICGLGGVGMYIGVLTLLSVTTTLQERPTYVGLTGLTWGMGTVLGPIIGGAFTDSNAGWRWAFYINLCIGGLCAPVYVFLLPKFDPRPGMSIRARLAEMDWVGAILLIGAFVSGIMAISFGGVLYAWNSGQTIACFVISFVLFVAFAIQQERAIFTTVSRRIFPVQFLRSRSMLILFAQTAAAATGIIVPLYMLPLYFQFTRGDSALESGVRILPYVMLLVFGCIVNGAVLSAHGLYMPWYLFGGVLVTVGGALMYTIDVNTPVANVYGYSLIVGLGVGVFVQASFSVAQAKAQPEEIPAAVGFITCAQITGLTIAIAIANSVFLNESETGIQALLPNVPYEQIQAAVAGTGSTLVRGLPYEQQQQILQVIVSAMSKTYIMCITAGALAIILSLFMKRERLFLTAAAA